MKIRHQQRSQGYRSPDVPLVEREAGDEQRLQLALMMESILRTVSGQHCLLTGKASSVHYLRHALTARDVLTYPILTQAHWSPGKIVLD